MSPAGACGLPLAGGPGSGRSTAAAIVLTGHKR